MAIDIGPKIGIDGEAQYRRELNQIIQGQKTLAAEAKATAAAMQDETDAEKKAAAEKDVLSRQIDNQREKLAKLQEGLTASARKYGEADTRTQKWQQAVYHATGELADLEHKLRSSDGEVEEIARDMGQAETAAAGWGDVMMGTLCADALKKGLSWIRDTVSGIAEKTLEASRAGADYADSMLTLSTTSGVALNTLQELSYMEGIADVSTNDVAGAIGKLKKTMATAESQNKSYAKKMAEAAKETDKEKRAAKEASIELGDTAAAYKALGISVKDANGNFRKSEDVFWDIVDALGKVEDETRRDNLAMTLMGKSATELNPLITAGADALAEMRKEAHDAGYVLSGPALQALGKQQDAMDRLDKKTESLSNRFASRLAPSMEHAYSLMGDTLDNPRVKRGLDVLADGIGGVISGVSELAAKALPGLMSLLGPLDDQLKYLTDDELALVESVDENKRAYEEMTNSFKARAQDILDETKRTEDLWKELQNMADESGKVKKKDEERAKFILTELNDALGTEYEMNGRIIQNYQDMQEEIDKLIVKREAEALIAAGAEEFANAEKNKKQAIEDSAKLLPSYEKAMRDAERAQRSYAKAVDYANKKEADGVWSHDKELDFIDDHLTLMNAATNELKTKSNKYQNARAVELKYYADSEKWQRAQTAAANGNYKEVVRILTDEFAVRLDYYRQKKQLNEQEKKDLRAKISEQELVIKEFKISMEQGLTGYSEAGLAELQSYVDEAKQILNGKVVAGHYLDGLIAGLNDPTHNRKVRQAAAKVAKEIDQNARKTLQIQSPSKVGAYIGKMWDAGLAKGLLANEGSVESASRRIAGAFTGPAAAYLPGTSSYSGGVTAAPLGAYTGGGTSSHSLSIGTIPISVTTTGQVNARELAREVSIQLTDQLQRAQRGGRL